MIRQHSAFSSCCPSAPKPDATDPLHQNCGCVAGAIPENGSALLLCQYVAGYFKRAVTLDANLPKWQHRSQFEVPQSEEMEV